VRSPRLRERAGRHRQARICQYKRQAGYSLGKGQTGNPAG
jgi:hypothetical protein